jgi:hypothetical protein
MTPEEYLSLGSLITICASALALIIKQLEQSRCSDINCLCIKCKREIPKEPEEPEEP